jgi:DNA/RNA endonuclease YhcR with UshA esterase domain
VSVTGSVVVEPGRILGDRTIVIQEGDSGIAVRLLVDTDLRPQRGDILQVQGELAQPYGNLEIRPARSSDVTRIGSGGLPEPLALDGRQLDETTEGILGRVSGTIIETARRSSGAVSILLRDDTGDFRVYLHAGHGVSRSDLTKGRRLRAVGIVGQRASRTGTADGYRLWPRGSADVASDRGDDPRATPSPGGPSDPGGPGSRRPPRVRIRAATPGSAATIVGVVTSRAGVIDTEGRRVTVEDESGALLVRYPSGEEPPSVGSVIRAWGDVETWFGAPQLEAAATPKRKGRKRVVPSVLRRPPTERDEWQLVVVTVRVNDVERSGETWRALTTLGAAGEIPVAGVAGSAIPSDTLEDGRTARIVGIVRRAHPQATDQRFTIVPRSTKDIRLGRAVDDEAGDGVVGPLAVVEGDDGAGGAGIALQDAAVAASLGSLDGFTGRVVRVGGRLDDVRARSFMLDDGTARRLVRLGSGSGEVRPQLREGEVVNVTGRVRKRKGAASEVVVRSAKDVRRAADLRLDGQPRAQAASVATDAAPRRGAPTVSAWGSAPTSASQQLALYILLGAAATASVAFGSAALLTLRVGSSLLKGRSRKPA